jgi:hypothetical protein
MSSWLARPSEVRMKNMSYIYIFPPILFLVYYTYYLLCLLISSCTYQVVCDLRKKLWIKVSTNLCFMSCFAESTHLQCCNFTMNNIAGTKLFLTFAGSRNRYWLCSPCPICRCWCLVFPRWWLPPLMPNGMNMHKRRLSCVY